MKTLLKSVIVSAVLVASAAAADQTIPWADNSGGTESPHIAAMGENLNVQHQAVTKSQEGVWADNSGSIKADEAVLGNGSSTAISQTQQH